MDAPLVGHVDPLADDAAEVCNASSFAWMASKEACKEATMDSWVLTRRRRASLASSDGASAVERVFGAMTTAEGMESVVATVSGYHGTERFKIIKLIACSSKIWYLIFDYLVVFARQVCWQFEGKKYNLARKLKTHIITHCWFEDCLKEGRRLPESPYTLQSGQEAGPISWKVPVILEGNVKKRPHFNKRNVESNHQKALQSAKGKEVDLACLNFSDSRLLKEDYGKIARPLTQLLQKDSFSWNEEAEEAFQALKLAMTSTPVLALPDFTQEFILETDASGVGIGAVLMQAGRPIAFYSKALAPRTLGLSAYEKELLAIIHAVAVWRPYLLGRHFKIRTDHQSLKHFLDQRVSSPLQQKWVTKLLGYDYEIVYHRGKENVVADALSRLPEAALSHLSGPLIDSLEDIQTEVLRSDTLGPMVEALQRGEQPDSSSCSTRRLRRRRNFHDDEVYAGPTDAVKIMEPMSRDNLRTRSPSPSPEIVPERIVYENEEARRIGNKEDMEEPCHSSKFEYLNSSKIANSVEIRTRTELCESGEHKDERRDSGSVSAGSALDKQIELSCVICWTEFCSSRGVLPCGHRFCYSCIQEWADCLAKREKISTKSLDKIKLSWHSKAGDRGGVTIGYCDKLGMWRVQILRWFHRSDMPDQYYYSYSHLSYIPTYEILALLYYTTRASVSISNSVCFECQNHEPEDLLLSCHICHSHSVHSCCLDPPLTPWTCIHCRDLRMLYQRFR
ncbi:hypothetical protein KSP39_PZI018278 [Platanthera zijinensis]|uniref:RING-type E3 ubiquitin transferase BRCA1 n=1 Tax=Platanthera zijinensis TaxID=2320716 RepID=A0AAP0B3L8_9ASPA